jgi:diguanylate cyclase (GGDEF)-like protein
MSRLAALVLTSLFLPQHVAAQEERLVELQRRVTSLEAEVDLHRRAASRNAAIAVAVGLGVIGFSLYRHRADANRLTERFGMTDALTGLKNRRYVLQTIDADCTMAMRRHRMAAAAGLAPPEDGDLLFFMIDIDHLKSVNERHGQAVGDRVLAQVADVLRSSCRTSDTVARWNGEEFLIILRFTNRDTAALSAERVRMAIEQRVVELGNGRSAGCTCSIGFAAFPLKAECPEEASWERVISLADEALQRAKSAGGNTWVGAGDSTDTPNPGRQPVIERGPAFGLS